MAAPRKHPDELRERATRMAVEARRPDCAYERRPEPIVVRSQSTAMRRTFASGSLLCILASWLSHRLADAPTSKQ